ncbi:penicillin-binding transpeptidase domain-containing protein [Kitasatospora sp. LaBMicrA B282]|uniref:penicillin-binding transpeptidase domain-containing protein n=1 Tax=Kitasatospora sp. LaBMicrA B282 TaxID=3420949 RepID=UPI003D0E491E
MRQGAKTAIVSGIAAAMLAAGGYGAYALFDSGSTSSKSAAPKPRTVVPESPTADLAATGAKSFLTAWAGGDLQGAAKLTDDPTAALAALTAFQQQVKPSALTLTPGAQTTATAFASATAQPSASASAKPSASPSAGASASGSPAPSASPAPAFQLPMTFKSHLEFAGTTNTWDYTGYLGMVKMSDGTSAVHWSSTVLNPHLGAGESLVQQPVFNPPTRVTDRNGQSLATFPSLSQILVNFSQNPPAQDPADAGTGVAIVNTANPQAKPEPLFTITDPKPGKPIKLTIDAGLEAAAQKAADEQYAKFKTTASVVAIEPSSGNILAVANSPATGFNMALQGQTAPGSTMKVITASALLEAGIDPNATMPCPSSYNTGTVYHNDFKDEEPNNTFMQDFTVSCNTAFIKQSMTTLQSGSLNKQASDVFGIGLNWKIGFPSFDGQVPGAGQSKDETAGEYFGQGKDLMNPLTLASVAATVDSGTFKQPVLMAGMPQLTAARQLSPDTLTKLRSMMNSVLTNPSGTAYNALQGVSGNIGGKTGTAEVSSNPSDPTNSWFTGYRDNLAVSVEVLKGGFGAAAAVPAAAEVLKVGNGS